MRYLACALILMVSLFGARAEAADQPDFTRITPDLFCPAHLRAIVPVHQLALDANEHDLGRDTRFGFQLRADTPKTMSGTVVVLSGTTVYKVVFPAQALLPVTVTSKEDGHVTLTRSQYDSKTMSIDFPSAVSIDAVWLDDTVVDGAITSCATMPLAYSPDRVSPVAGLHFQTEDTGLTSDQVRSAVLGVPGLHALRTSTVSREGCSSLISDASAVQLEKPEYPSGVIHRGVTTVVRVAIDAAGAVADASVLRSAGELPFDLSALVAASHSRFRPRQFLCSPIPGLYSLRFNFR